MITMIWNNFWQVSIAVRIDTENTKSWTFDSLKNCLEFNMETVTPIFITSQTRFSMALYQAALRYRFPTAGYSQTNTADECWTINTENIDWAPLLTHCSVTSLVIWRIEKHWKCIRRVTHFISTGDTVRILYQVDPYYIVFTSGMIFSNVETSPRLL